MQEDLQRPGWEPEPPPPEVGSQPHRLSSVDRLWRAFTAPAEVFAAIDVKPTWVLCLALFVVLGVAVQYVVLPHVDNEATLRAQLGDRIDEVGEARLEQMVEQGETFSRFVPLISLVVVPVAWAIIAGVFFVMLKIAGSEIDFPRTLSTALHAYWPPSVVGSVLLAVLVQRVGRLPQQELGNVVRSHLGAFLSPDAPSWLSAAASTVSVFNVWTVILLVVGFELVGKIPRGRAVAVVLVPWGVYLAGKAGLAALFG